MAPNSCSLRTVRPARQRAKQPVWCLVLSTGSLKKGKQDIRKRARKKLQSANLCWHAGEKKLNRRK